MGIRMLPVDETGLVVNVLEISTMKLNADESITVTQSGGTVSTVSKTHEHYAEWKELVGSGWRYISDAAVPDDARSPSDVVAES